MKNFGKEGGGDRIDAVLRTDVRRLGVRGQTRRKSRYG